MKKKKLISIDQKAFLKPFKKPVLRKPQNPCKIRRDQADYFEARGSLALNATSEDLKQL